MLLEAPGPWTWPWPGRVHEGPTGPLKQPLCLPEKKTQEQNQIISAQHPLHFGD